MFYAVDALHQIFQRAGDELDGVFGAIAVGLHDDIHHGHADLRLFLARQGDERDGAHDQSRQQQ